MTWITCGRWLFFQLKISTFFSPSSMITIYLPMHACMYAWLYKEKKLTKKKKKNVYADNGQFVLIPVKFSMLFRFQKHRWQQYLGFLFFEPKKFFSWNAIYCKQYLFLLLLLILQYTASCWCLVWIRPWLLLLLQPHCESGKKINFFPILFSDVCNFHQWCLMKEWLQKSTILMMFLEKKTKTWRTRKEKRNNDLLLLLLMLMIVILSQSNQIIHRFDVGLAKIKKSGDRLVYICLFVCLFWRFLFVKKKGKRKSFKKIFWSALCKIQQQQQQH